jgi:GntR family transcriptional regulator, arabinose operon transcriptional repressor
MYIPVDTSLNKVSKVFMNKVSDIVLLHNSVISLHVQLHNQLRQLILSGRWKRGSRIPSESELTAYLKVSRSTVRLGLQAAEIEGLIERTAGRGTFVAYLPSKEHENRLVAFVTYGFDTESHLMMLKGAENELKAHGYQVILSNVQTHHEELNILQRLKAEYVAGVLLWPYAEASRPQPPSAFSYQQIRLPMVLMDRQIYGIECDCVTSDNYGGGRALMEHFISLGHQNIVFLTHHETELLTVVERYRAYRDVMREAGLTAVEPWYIGQPGHEIGAGDTFRSSHDLNSPELQQIKEYLFTAQPRPTAIFALNDYLAVLATRTLKLLGMRVPDSMSIGGFDDIDLAAHLEVPLTTVAQDMFLIGKHAAQVLLGRLGGYTGPSECAIIPTELRIRSSTAVPLRVEL